MSTFGGKIQEIPNVSVDRFDGENFESEAYFLSHCHTDHMVGLRMRCFQEHLVKNNKYLYASQISCTILKRMYPDIKNNLKELVVNIPITIALKTIELSVTLIPAGHCPGSVMFLFETDKRILYTGDYRIRKNDITKFKIFYDNFNKVKIIDKIYLDTTFFLKKYLRFPKREESLQELINIIFEWINKGKSFYINLVTSAKYGYEYVFNEIFNKINMQIHVGEDAFRFYSLIPEMDKSVTLDGRKTQIHSHCYGFKETCIQYIPDADIKYIKVSAFRWTQEDLTEGMSEYDSGVHYVCYSTHASYEEGVALIRFLKPKQIEICVKHDDPNTNKEMMDLIEEHLEEFKIDLEDEATTPKLFETNKIRYNKKNKKSREEFSEILNSPPRDSFKIPKIIEGNDSNESFVASSSLTISTDAGKSRIDSNEDIFQFLFVDNEKCETTSKELSFSEEIKSDTDCSLETNCMNLQTDKNPINIDNPRNTSSASENIDKLENNEEDEAEKLIFDIINA